MLPFVRHGPVRQTMIRALECIRADASLLTAALGVFVREPTVDWLELANKQARIQGKYDLSIFNKIVTVFSLTVP